MASLASYSAAITELQNKLAHNINVIVLSHSLCSLIDWLKMYLQNLTYVLNGQTEYRSKIKIERKYVGRQSQANTSLEIAKQLNISYKGIHYSLQRQRKAGS